MPRYSLDEDQYFSDEDFYQLYKDGDTNVVLNGKNLNFQNQEEDDIDEIDDDYEQTKIYIRLYEELRNFVERNYLPIFEYGNSFNLKEFLESV